MKKVLLVMQSPLSKKNFISVMPPLGILYISSFLESRGITAEVIDCNISDIEDSVVRDYDVVGFSVNCGNITNTLAMAKRVKSVYGKEVIVGGPQVTSDPDFFLRQEYIDGAVIGEGEHTLYEYIKEGTAVKGLYLKGSDGKVAFGGDRPFIKELGSLPFPALRKVNLRRYSTPMKRKMPISAVVTSRGCPFGCIFCFHALGYPFRSRNAEDVVNEIEWQVKDLGVGEICILDDNLTLDIARAKEIFSGIIERKINVSFQLYNGIRVDRVDEELMKLMKKAGVWYMNISPESGDPDTVKRIDKGFDRELAKKVVDASKRLGLFTYASFMIGFPWETEEHIRRTIDFAVELDTDVAQFARVIAFPNTKLYDMCQLDYKIEGDIGLFYNDPKFSISLLSESEINGLIKSAYRKFYFSPKRALRLLRKLRWADLFSMFRYSLTTESI